MAYDSARGVTVLFGGYTFGPPAQYLHDTWEWNGSAWTQVNLTGTSPGGRSNFALAYDSTRGVTVLFGGGSSDTWEWNGSTWTEVNLTGTSPNPRYGNAMAFDSTRGVTVLFGGDYIRVVISGNGSVYYQDTWEWNGSTWTNVTPSGTNPSAGGGSSMAFDSARGRGVLFDSNNTWEWDGSTWTKVTPVGMSPSVAETAIAYDSAKGAVVLFGGLSGAEVDLQDTWEWKASPTQQPAFQFDASSYNSGIGAAAVSGLRVRAFAGGVFSPGNAASVGATLLGWRNGGVQIGPGAWSVLLSNSVGVASRQPYLGAPSTTLIDWQAPGASTAQQFLTERDGQLSFQVRPSGSMGSAIGGASVALDYIEVRVRYQAQ